VAENARHIVLLVFGAVEAKPVGVTARAADTVAPDAKLLAGTAVTSCTRHRIDASLLTVLTA
jgi:hypothetical protein